MKRIYTFLLAVVLLAGMLVSCQSAVSVNRLSADADIDLSGNWNDTDIRLVSQALVESSLASPWVNQYKPARNVTGGPVPEVGCARWCRDGRARRESG